MAKRNLLLTESKVDERHVTITYVNSQMRENNYVDGVGTMIFGKKKSKTNKYTFFTLTLQVTDPIHLPYPEYLISIEVIVSYDDHEKDVSILDMCEMRSEYTVNRTELAQLIRVAIMDKLDKVNKKYIYQKEIRDII